MTSPAVLLAALREQIAWADKWTEAEMRANHHLHENTINAVMRARSAIAAFEAEQKEAQETEGRLLEPDRTIRGTAHIRYAQPTPPSAEDEAAWLIYFEDADRQPEIFMGAGAAEAARKRHAVLRDTWNCTLFCPALSDRDAVIEELAKEADGVETREATADRPKTARVWSGVALWLRTYKSRPATHPQPEPFPEMERIAQEFGLDSPQPQESKL